MKMNEVARSAGLPLVGHAPVRLGLDALIEARQPLAHIGALTNIYFLPLAGNQPWLVATAAAVTGLLILWIPDAVAMLLRRRREWTASSSSTARMHTLVGWALLVSQLAALCGALFLPGGPYYASVTLRLAFSALVGLSWLSAVVLVAAARAVWLDRNTSILARLHAALAVMVTFTFAVTAAGFWLPVSWRSSERGIERLARRLHDADIPVMTTIGVYDVIGGPDKSRLTRNPSLAYVSDATRARWTPFMHPGPPGYRYTDFVKKVCAALHRAGVRLIAGTDAMGFPLMVPGSSLQSELELLVQCGLTPREAITAATAAPAALLRREKEFGSIAPGMRADLLIVDANPLEDITRLRQLYGVVVRGRWLSATEMDQRIQPLAGTP